MKTNLTGLLLASLILSSVRAVAVTRYVDLNSSSPMLPYLDWSTAATNIQEAIDVADPGDLVLVTNGVYQNGGSVVSPGLLTNRVAVTKSLTLRSVNGPGVTIIQGHQVPVTVRGPSAVRCVYLADGAVLDGFTLTNGATFDSGNIQSTSGGGVWCNSNDGSFDAVVANCYIIGNSAVVGGGTRFGTCSNTVITLNSASQNGGGVAYCHLRSCIVSSNSAASGGGVFDNGSWAFSAINSKIIGNETTGFGAAAFGYVLNSCLVAYNDGPTGTYGSYLRNTTVTEQTGVGVAKGVLNNSIVYFNGELGTNNHTLVSWIQHTCTTPAPAGGWNFTNEPAFINAAEGNFRLSAISLCINAGANSGVTNTAPTDLDGNPRFAAGTVDVGAYEFQTPSSPISYAWLHQYGLSLDGSEDFVDGDNDGMSNYGEWRSDTIPTDSSSVLRLLSVTNVASGVNVTWKSAATRRYWLERATNCALPSFFRTVATNISGAAGSRTYTDSSATNEGPYFYRVGVQ